MAKVRPNKPRAGHKVRLIVTVGGDLGVVAVGQVKITVDGHTVTKTLRAGGLKLKLKKLGKGKHKVKVVYLGSANVVGSSATVKFKAS